MPPPLVTIVLDLGNSCLCYGCRQKTCKVLNKIQGVREHSCNLETNQIILTGTVDPAVIVENLAKIKPFVRVSAVDYHHMPPPHGTHNGTPPPCCTCPQDPPHPTHEPHPSHINAPQPHGTSGSHRGCDQEQAPPPVHYPSRYSIHIHVPEQEQGKPSSSHRPPQQHHCKNEPSHLPPQRTQQHVSCREPPPTSACQCPPPNHNAVAQSPQPPKNPADQLDNFLQGSSSPLIPTNISGASILGQLAKIPQLKNVELIKKKGIKFSFQDGQVKSYHPISHMEVRPGYAHAAPPHHQPPRYISPFSDEHPYGACTIM